MKRGRGGNSFLEAAMFLPILITLLVACEQVGKLTLTYYTLKKVLYNAARYIGTSQGVNFCDAADPNIVAGMNFALTGTTDGSGTPLVSGLTADMLLVAYERVDSTGQALAACDCSISGCDAAAGGGSPDYITISIPDGFTVTPIIPFLTLQPISLKPAVKVPYGGT
jgi:hypothetical protein